MRDIAGNVKAVRDRMARAAKRVGGRPEDVKLIAVTKTVTPSLIREAVAAGLREFGENRVQEALKKIAVIKDDVRWHMVGRLQTNKVRLVVGVFDLIHSVDELKVAQEIEKWAEKKGLRQKVLIQVNVSGEAAKGGVLPSGVSPFLRDMAKLKRVTVCGLMTIPPLAAYPEESRTYFRRLAEIREAVWKEGIDGMTPAELSMGMSGDFEVAIEEGATLVRIGTAIFGPREKGHPSPDKTVESVIG